jgi:hypothetical protein
MLRYYMKARGEHAFFYICVSQTLFLIADPLWRRKIITVSHIIAHVNVCLDERYAKLKICILELILDILGIHTITIRNNTLNDLSIIKLIVPFFVGTGSFLIRYSKGHMK